MDDYRRETWGAKFRGYAYWLIIFAIIGAIVWLVSAYTGVASETVPGTDAAPGVDQDSTARPDTNGIEKIKLTEDTMRVHVNVDSDFSTYRIEGPDGYSFQVPTYSKEDYVFRENKPEGWPAGEYTVTELDSRNNEYESYTFELEPES